MRGKTYLKNAAILTVSGLVLRALGMVFRVYIAAHLGGEGMGLYQMILAVYMVFVSAATAGVNVASTRLAAESLARGHGMGRTVRSLVVVAALFGTAAMLCQYGLAAPLAGHILHDARAEFSLRVLAPSLPFMAMSGALRGCFLASRRVNPNVVAQLIEQGVRMAVAAVLLQYFDRWGAGYGCAAVLIGNTVSEGVSWAIMAGWALHEPEFQGVQPGESRPYTQRELWGILLPVEGSRLLASVLQATESTLIPLCLTAYTGARALAVSQYGALKGMAMPLLFFPFSVLAALSGLLMPEITRATTNKDAAATNRLVDTMMTATMLFSVLAAVLFVLFGGPVARLLYGSAEVGSYVEVLGLIAPFMYVESMVDGVLKGRGEQWATFRYSLLDSAFRIVSIGLLLPKFGIKGFLGVMVVSNVLTCTLNTGRMLRCTGLKLRWVRWIWQPISLAVLAGGAGLAVLALPGGDGVWRLAGACGTVCGVYLALAWGPGGASALLRKKVSAGT